MAFYKNKNRLKLAKWVKYFFIFDIIVFIFLLLINPNFWANNAYTLGSLAFGVIITFLIYDELLKYKDNNWRKLAEILGTLNVGLNAVFYIIIIGAIFIGVLNAASSIGSLSVPTIPHSQNQQQSGSTNSPSIFNLGSSGVNTGDVEQSIFQKINAARASNGVNSLVSDSNLASIARGHSQDMAKNNYMAHVDPQGLDPSARATKAGYSTRKDIGNNRYQTGIGEIIAKMPTGNVQLNCPSGLTVVPNTPNGIADAMMDSWMNHDSCQGNGHRNIILSNSYSNAGVGVAYDGQYYLATVDFW